MPHVFILILTEILSMLKGEQLILFAYLYLKWEIYQNGSISHIILLSIHEYNIMLNRHKLI